MATLKIATTQSIRRFAFETQLKSSGGKWSCITLSKRLLSSQPVEEQPTNTKDSNNVSYSLYCWGTNNKGTLPLKELLKESKSGNASESTAGNILNRRSSEKVYDHPVSVDLDEAFGIDNKTTTIRDICLGPTGTAAIMSNNTCYTFGDNTSGQLGHGHTNDVPIPTLLNPPDSSPLYHDQIAQIAMGANFSAIIDTNGDLYTFGYNGSVMKEGVGCLGHGYFPEEYIHSPKLVDSLVEDGCYASQVAVGNAHMTVLTTEGEVLTCGAGAYGRCGNLEPLDQLFLEPVELLASESNIVQISGGKDFSMALSGSDGIVFTWGRNDKGQCGTGTGLSVEMYAMEPMPVAVEGLLEGRKVVKIDAGHSHAAALTDKGELFVWGMAQSFLPEQVISQDLVKIVDFSCGKDYTIAIGEDGNAYSFGKGGKTGVLGLASEKSVMHPTLLEALIGKKVKKVFAGWNHAACLLED
jgi:alpha-tubulin suppressor-like RCC1 family protein